MDEVSDTCQRKKCDRAKLFSRKESGHVWNFAILIFLNPTCYQLFNSSGQIKYDVLIDLMEGPDGKISGLRLLSWN